MKNGVLSNFYSRYIQYHRGKEDDNMKAACDPHGVKDRSAKIRKKSLF
jgi:hypothetical protein